MRKVILQFLGILICLLAGASISLACTCLHLRGDPSTGFKVASAVFAGKVIEINQVAQSGSRIKSRILAVKFRVEKSWKLIEKDVVTVLTSDTSSMCGFTFKKGKRYLVYAHEHRNEFSTDICTRTNLFMEAKEDLEYLNGKGLLKGKK
jgi:hypothetical protein